MIWVIIIAIVCIAGLGALALINNIDGATLGLALAAIAGLGGFELKAIIEKRKEKK